MMIGGGVNINRDDRFKQILQQQLGENGVALLVNQAFLFLLALVMMVAILIGVITSQSKNCLTLKSPALI